MAIFGTIQKKKKKIAKMALLTEINSWYASPYSSAPAEDVGAWNHLDYESRRGPFSPAPPSGCQFDARGSFECHLAFEDGPDVFNGIEVWAIRRPLHKLNIILL